MITKVSNSVEVNESLLHNLIKVACKALEVASLHSENNDLIAVPKNASEVEIHNDNINSIITAKLKNKFNL